MMGWRRWVLSACCWCAACATWAGDASHKEAVSLQVQDADVRGVLQGLAELYPFNILMSDAVKGRVSLRLEAVPWRQAVEWVAQSQGLAWRWQGDTVWIGTPEEMVSRDTLRLQAALALEAVEPLRTQGFRLQYAKATDIVTQLLPPGDKTGAAPRMLSARGSAMAEPRSNHVFVTDTDARLQRVTALIAQVDIPVRQVMIEARIVEAEDSFGKALGVRLGAGVPDFRLGNRTQARLGPNYGSLTTVEGETPSAPFVNLPANPSSAAAATVALSLFSPAASRFLNLEISALESDGKGRIVSSPRVVTADQVKALIEQGTEFPYQTATASGATAIAFRKANLKLEVTPRITPEGHVVLDLSINKDSRGETTTSGIAINTKHVQTQVLIENGGTVVIGGIFEHVEREELHRVPGLGRLPMLGALFRSRQTVFSKSELLVFITPRVLHTHRAEVGG
jgi:type IV pilus assembly protein PilQ